MAVLEMSQAALRVATRRAYELGRLEGAMLRGAGWALLAMPGFLFCNQTLWAGICLGGFALVVAAGRMRGEGYEEGSRAGALAGILPCLLPATVRALDPDLCALLSTNGPWLCGIGGIAAGAVLALRGRASGGVPFWSGALAALGFAASLGCLPVGAIGFAGLGLGVIAGGVPVLASRRAFI